MKHEQYLLDALPDNSNGKLSTDQILVLRKMMTMRGVTAWILIICGLIVATPTAIGLFALDSSGGEPIYFWIMLILTIVFIAIAVFGFKINASKKEGLTSLDTLPVETITGKPEKHDMSAPVRAPIPGGGSYLAFVPLRTGWIKMNDKSFGVLPGPLYQMIENNKVATFYTIPLKGVGFKDNVIINYKP